MHHDVGECCVIALPLTLQEYPQIAEHVEKRELWLNA